MTYQPPRANGKPKLLEEMTSAEVAAALEHTDVVIVTPSAVEQHGAHLPLGTDWYIGIETTRRTIDKLAAHGKAAVGYAFPLGISHKFLDFPGSITLNHDTFVAVVKEIIGCLQRQGFRRFVLLSGNGGNGATMQVAAEAVHYSLGVDALFVDALPYQYGYVKDVLKRPDVEHHAGEGETSKILATRPELVRTDQLIFRDPNENAKHRTRHAPGIKKAHEKWADFAPAGYVGAPDLAEAATGDVLYERNSDWIVAAIEKEYFQGVVD